MRPPPWYPPEYAALARAALEGSAVGKLLQRRPAVVLERLARGGGATNWYALNSTDDLEGLANLVAPGSMVSFYFDGRIAEVRLDEATREHLAAIAHRDGDAVVAIRTAGIELERDFPAGRTDLDDWLHEMGDPDRGFVGAYPGRDNDGVNAVTLVLPDLDGESRPHPY